jgi:hypothetical protein
MVKHVRGGLDVFAIAGEKSLFRKGVGENTDLGVLQQLKDAEISNLSARRTRHGCRVAADGAPRTVS